MRKWKTEALSLDAAYERRAIEQGLVLRPIFPENDIDNMILPKVYDDKLDAWFTKKDK